MRLVLKFIYHCLGFGFIIAKGWKTKRGYFVACDFGLKAFWFWHTFLLVKTIHLKETEHILYNFMINTHNVVKYKTFTSFIWQHFRICGSLAANPTKSKRRNPFIMDGYLFTLYLVNFHLLIPAFNTRSNIKSKRGILV